MKRTLLALSVIAAASQQAAAYQFDTSDDWEVRWDNTIKANTLGKLCRVHVDREEQMQAMAPKRKAPAKMQMHRGAQGGAGSAPAKPQTVRRSHPKVGRNDPCPCGSGKKYKKCCLGKESDVA